MPGKDKETRATEGCCDKCSCDWEECKKAIEACCKEANCSCDCIESIQQLCCTAA